MTNLDWVMWSIGNVNDTKHRKDLFDMNDYPHDRNTLSIAFHNLSNYEIMKVPGDRNCSSQRFKECGNDANSTVKSTTGHSPAQWFWDVTPRQDGRSSALPSRTTILVIHPGIEKPMQQQNTSADVHTQFDLCPDRRLCCIPRRSITAISGV